MPDNKTVDNGSLTDIPVATDEVTYSGDTGQQVQLMRPVLVAGAEGAKTVTDMPGDATYGWDVDIARISDPELGIAEALTSLRDLQVTERYSVLADSLADGIASFWTQATASSGTITNASGEELLSTTANATGSAQITGPNMDYYPGQVHWLMMSGRLNDSGSAGNIRRWGVYTISGTTPQNGFYFEINGTTMNAVYVNAASATATASGSWSKAATAPFTIDANYHSWEIRYTANSVWFYIDGVLRHVVTGTTAAITSTLNLPMTAISVNTSGATNRVLAIRNIGQGRFGKQPDVPSQFATAQTNISNTAATVVAARANRKNVTISNNQGETVYVGPATVTTSNGLAIPPGAAVTIETTQLVQGITAAATVDSSKKLHTLETYY